MSVITVIMVIIVTTVAEGTARITWTPDTPIDVLRHTVVGALVEHARVDQPVMDVDVDETAAVGRRQRSVARAAGRLTMLSVPGR